MIVGEETCVQWRDEMNKPTPEDLLRQVWSKYFRHVPWDRAFFIDQRLPDAVARDLHPVPAEMVAALDCWRANMIAAVDEVVQRYKNDPSSWKRYEAELIAASDEELIAELTRRGGTMKRELKGK
jgi:tRNA uridine 5-carbamoylmethylation protein Kti12